MMRRILYTILISFCLLSSLWADGSRYTTESVLNTGKWVKIRVAETGIYKLTFSDLQKMGFSNPDKVSVYGYGGWPLEENFSLPYSDDLPPVAIYKGADYLLFYGKGPVKWEYNSTDGFVHTNNPYSQYGYYFLTESDVSPKVMETQASESGASLKITTFDDYLVYEKEQVSVNASGRELYGESFDTNLSQVFNVSVPGITDDEGKASLSFISKVTSGTGNVTMSIDGNTVIEAPISSNTAEYVMALEAKRNNISWTGDKSEHIKVNIQYSRSGQKNTRLNYFRLQMVRELKSYGAYTFFRSLASRYNASRFVIQNANANMLVLDVTDGLNPKRMETELNGTELSFSIPASYTLREFVIVQPGQLKAPEKVGDVVNQNLHGLAQQDMIILAQPNLLEQAERLAEAHRTHDNLTVQVVEPEKVYNEFSSGTPDASAYRRFMKMFYDRKTSDEDAPKYLLLLGDGSYDNRQLTNNWKQVDMTNMLLTYQTKESLTDQSYVIDDYFGFLDDKDTGTSLQNYTLNLGIGRFPVRTVQQAKQTVDKVVSYMENKNVGSWKNNLCFLADDGNSADNFAVYHLTQADEIAERIESEHPEFLINKLYFDAYKKDYTGGHTSYPDVNSNLSKLMKDGLLLLNYTGHGGTTALSEEMVVKQTDIAQYTYTRLPLWITATCDFTRFDDLSTSAGEDVFLKENSGGIGLFTTVRVAYSGTNSEINQKLNEGLFKKNKGHRLTLGEVMKETKNGLTTIRKLGFCLIGDPALKLAYPEYRMQVTSINGASVDGSPIPFKALEKITVEGEVLNAEGNLATDFTGVINPTVKDSKVTVTTLDNNGTGNTASFTDYPNTLYVGNDSVRNGKFSFTFTVPKDISYSNKQGKMSLYASDAINGNEAQGAFLNFIVGGTSDTAETDTIGPEIRALYLNDTTFVDGGRVNTTPYFVAELWDKSGVNISGSSVGHDMMLVIDGSSTLSYNLNSYYQLLPGEEGVGIVKFMIPQLQPGLHEAEFWVWDIQNNSTLYTFTFEVVEGLKPFITEIVATPSPAREQVTFHLFHNRPESRVTVGIMVYDLTGRLYWKHEETGSSDLFNAYTVTWDLTNNAGGRIRPGVYIYRAAISTDNSKEATEAKKLIILAP
nr:type IX secretion system sortase PorU [Parabacteroides sp. AM08-6]